MLFSGIRKKSSNPRSLTSKEILERPVHLNLMVGDVVYARVNDVWRAVIIIDAVVGQRDAEKRKRVYQGVWETGDGLAMRAWFCPELDGALRPIDAYHTELLRDAGVQVFPCFLLQ